mmetsp:Transcript_5394/g.18091  ORF Transcript_5394/g.18091 Transcript_5394/m.18091 type:complete len:845 (-) Transcript_5394:153-2687(-)
MGRDSTGFGARFIFRLELPARARTLVRCLHPQRPPEALPPRRVRKPPAPQGSAPARPPQRRPRERRRVHAAGTAGFLVGTPPCAAMMGLKNMAKSAGQLASSTASGLASRAGDIAAKSGVTDMAKSAAQSAGGMVSKGASAVGTAAGTALSPLKSMASGPEVVRDPVEDAADIAAIEAAYKKAEEGMRLFISGELEAMEKFFAEQTVHDKPGEPPVFHHCHAMIMSIKALVTGDDGDIKAALELINRVVGMCQECFPKRGYVKGALDWGKSWFKVSVVSPKELGARLIVAEECYLAGGLHMFEESMSSFFKGVLSFHRAVAGYRHCTAVYDLPGQPAAVHDKGAIAGGMAATQLAMSLIPARMLAMIKLLGFKVDRAAALQKLADASLEGGPRAPVFACIRILYHVLIPSLFSLPAERRTHAEEAQASFDFLKDEWPGHLHSYLLGRQLRLNGDVAGAIMQFRQVASIQSTDPGWQRLQITWQYELALSHMHQLSWEESERHWGLLASGLFKESWSPGLFHYNRGVCLVMMGQLADAAGEFGEAEAVIRAKRKFIGRTPSEDQYVLRKVRDYKLGSEESLRALGPIAESLAGEVLFIWNAFGSMEGGHLEVLRGHADRGRVEAIRQAAEAAAAAGGEGGGGGGDRGPVGDMAAVCSLVKAAAAVAVRWGIWLGAKGVGCRVLRMRAREGAERDLNTQPPSSPPLQMGESTEAHVSLAEAEVSAGELRAEHWVVPHIAYVRALAIVGDGKSPQPESLKKALVELGAVERTVRDYNFMWRLLTRVHNFKASINAMLGVEEAAPEAGATGEVYAGGEEMDEEALEAALQKTIEKEEALKKAEPPMSP